MKKHTVRQTVSKPRKPYASFPLFAHGSGQRAKKIRGKRHFFGQWARRKNGMFVYVNQVDASAANATLKFDRERPYLR